MDTSDGVTSLTEVLWESSLKGGKIQVAVVRNKMNCSWSLVSERPETKSETWLPEAGEGLQIHPDIIPQCIKKYTDCRKM